MGGGGMNGRIRAGKCGLEVVMSGHMGVRSAALAGWIVTRPRATVALIRSIVSRGDPGPGWKKIRLVARSMGDQGIPGQNRVGPHSGQRVMPHPRSRVWTKN